MKTNANWYSKGKAEADKGIPCGERVVGIAIVVFSVLMVLYFTAHQRQSTGFFTAEYGTLEMIALYGYWVFWIVSAGLEGVLGLRLPSRIFDTFGGSIFAAICIAWLLVVFPSNSPILQTCYRNPLDFWCSGLPTTSLDC